MNFRYRKRTALLAFFSKFMPALVEAAEQFVQEWGPEAGVGVAAGAGLAFLGSVLAEGGVGTVAAALAAAGITGIGIWAAISCYEHGT